jgi:hypothetical protein
MIAAAMTLAAQLEILAATPSRKKVFESRNACFFGHGTVTVTEP